MEQNCLREDLADVYSHYAEDLTTLARLEKDLGFAIVYSFCDLFKKWAATFSRRKWLYENRTHYFDEIIVNLKEFFTLLEELRSRLIGNFKSPLERIVMEAELNLVVERCTRRLILQVAKFIESHWQMLIYDSKNCLDALSSAKAYFKELNFEDRIQWSEFHDLAPEFQTIIPGNWIRPQDSFMSTLPPGGRTNQRPKNHGYYRGTQMSAQYARQEIFYPCALF
ncbi:hypothetical protein ACTXT7_015275 [Hymenolepis weldensis]